MKKSSSLKRLLSVAVLSLMAVRLLACATPGTHNYYLFSTIDADDWEYRQNLICMDNWRAYIGKDDFYWFDADEVRKVAQQKGDALMMSYVDNLKKYLDVAAKVRETWEYPTKKELLRRQQTLMSIQKYAFSKTTTRLRSQHALLYMRCNMMLGDHRTNVTFWESTASKFINSVYRDMMRNIYAGALLKTGRINEATQIFMEQGDMASLYTFYYQKRSYEAIRQEYLRNPNAPALPFLLQDFANNAQEAYDEKLDEYNLPGKLFVRDIKKSEAMQMCALARQVVKEGKSQDPALWLSLEAWLQYLFGDRRQALASIRQAVSLDGKPRIKDNARVLRLFIEASVGKADAKLDDFLAKELSWLEEAARQERGNEQHFENHYTQAYDRLVHQVLMPNYTKAGRTNEANAFLAVYDEQPKVFYMLAAHRQSRVSEYGWNNDYSSDFFCHIDSMAIPQLEQYLAYTNRKPVSALDKWLSARIRHDNDFFHEVLGTKYLRLARWKEAEKHLAQVSLDFINTMNIVPFMARRDFRVEPWIKRQRIRQELQEPGTARTTVNQKLAFVREMIQMEQGFGSMKAEAKARRAYDLAVRYAQASYAGDAWYLTRYGKSCYEEPRSDEMNMVQKASELLQTAQSLDDFLWKEKTYFALAWLPFDSWYTEEWDSKTATYVKKPLPRSYQYRALYHLANYERQNASRTSAYVSRCDVLKQFLKSLSQ
jgi:hypothetical protein